MSREPYETYELGKYKLEIVYDDSPTNPRDDFNITKMVCFHKRYSLGDKDHGYVHDQYSSWGEMRQDIIKKEKPRIIKPLYMYDHSGQTISTKPFSCPWDSGQIGWVYITKEAGHKRPRKEKLDKWLEAEVKLYDMYIGGEIFGYILTDTESGQEDSCWNFYGSDPFENGMSEHLPDEVVSALRIKLGKKAA